MDHTHKLTELLAEKGASVTKARLAVFAALQAADEPLKTGEIARRTPSIDRASVYRTLELFATLGITTTIVRGWTPHTELAEPFRPHHHHIVCEQCGRAESINNETLEDVLSLIATRHNFTLAGHTVELSGLCQNCHD